MTLGSEHSKLQSPLLSNGGEVQEPVPEGLPKTFLYHLMTGKVRAKPLADDRGRGGS